MTDEPRTGALDADAWGRVQAAFHRLRELPREDRDEELRALGDSASEVRAWVESLLEHHDGAAREFLDAPATGAFPGAVAELLAAEGAIGGYELVGVLGRGGMGVVFEARQRDPERRVALKVLHAGLHSPSAVARFRHEAELLARLQHPGIAQVIEAGLHRLEVDGEEAVEVPYFALEFVAGAATLLEFADRESLDLRGRLQLFLDVCDAVHHAHLRGVIHRDLKPANLLLGDDGRVKVIDYGVARAVDVGNPEHTLAGDIVGTLGYMSPEQGAGDPRAVDLRTDVYSLGVVLFELLTQRRPYDLPTTSVLDAAIALRAVRPRSASEFVPALRGDVDVIVAKALAREPGARYPSVGELAEDVRRHLACEPIHARPPSLAYRLTRFARRQRVLVTATVAVTVALFAGTWAAVRGEAVARAAEREARASEAAAEVARAEEARQRLLAVERSEDAVREAARADRGEAAAREALARAVAARDDAEATISILENAIASAQSTREGPLVTLGTVLERAARLLDSYEYSPRVRGRVLAALGGGFRSLGRYDDAVRLLEECVAVRRAADVDAASLADAEQRLAVALGDRGDYRAARELLQAAYARLGGEDAEPSRTLYHVQQRSGDLAQQIGDHTGALSFARSAFATLQELPDVPAEFRVDAAMQLGIAEQGLREFERAAEIYEDALEALAEVEPDGGALTGTVLSNLGEVRREQGEADLAVELMREGLRHLRRVFGDDHPQLGVPLHNLGGALVVAGRHDEVDAVMREAMRLQIVSYGPDHLEVVSTEMRLGDAQLVRGEKRLGLETFRSAAARARRAESPDHFAVGVLQVMIGGLLVDLGELAEAEATLLDAHRILLAATSERGENTLAAAAELARCYEAMGADEPAAMWRSAVSAGR